MSLEGSLWERRISGRHHRQALGLLSRAPPLLREALTERYVNRAGASRHFYSDSGRVRDSYNDAFADLRDTAHRLEGAHVRTAFDDDAIEAAADRAARFCRASSTLERALTYARAQRARLPKGPRVTHKSLRARLLSPDWWRRQLRCAYTRTAEELIRELGYVRAQAGPYISDDALERMRRARSKNKRWIGDSWMVSEDSGESLPLSGIIAHSLANPTLRRGELMLRARGFQELAQSMGHRALMVTLTAPSAFHPYLREGPANPLYEGYTPREAQRWLCGRWASARAALKRLEVLYYGFRAAEPHHDATPHWHLVLWAPEHELQRITTVLRATWLKHYSDEPGASQHRVAWTVEDPAKGSGVGYLAKYVAKSIDGIGMAETHSDESGRPVSEDAERVIAWARLHGIRQFQQLGGPAVTLWRELRRVREPCDVPPLEQLRLCVDGDDSQGPSWHRFIETLGGAQACVQRSRELFDKQEPRCVDSAGRKVLRMTRWGEFPAPRIVGVRLIWRDRIHRLTTRVSIWFLVFLPGSGSSSPWTRGNNCITYGETSCWTNPNETSQAPP